MKQNNWIAWGWKITLILMGIIGLLSTMSGSPGFWSSYGLDIFGPAWNYILFRDLYTSPNASFLSLKFSPEKAAAALLGICFLIETSQYFRLYEAHYDPYDYLAYLSLAVALLSFG